jgi:signal transduction histidine kinase
VCETAQQQPDGFSFIFTPHSLAAFISICRWVPERNCPVSINDLDALKARIAELEQELGEVKQKNLDLERSRSGAATEDLSVPINEFEETLRRLVQRTAMIVQAEKCVIMVRDRETGDLIARAPAFGMDEGDVSAFRVGSETGISGTVFAGGQPGIFASPEAPSAVQDRGLYQKLGLKNGVTVPLLIERRDDQNHVVDRITIGVLHCFNKRYGGEFNEEDVRLLERLSRNAAAVIANAQMFRDVVEERQKLVHTLDSLTSGLVLINSHGRVGQMNAQARAMFGVGDSINPVGAAYEDIIKHEATLEVLKKRLSEEELADKGEDQLSRKPDEMALVDDQGQAYVYQVHTAFVHDDNGGVIGTAFIFNDITDLRNVERMKTEFVSIVSHELRTPLTPMKGFVRMLLDDPQEEMFTIEDRMEFYGIIDENVDRLGRLIDDLLNVSRIEKMGAAGIEMNWAKVDLYKVVESVLNTQRGRTDKHTFAVDFDPESITIETDPDKIQNILHNYINNAIKYSPQGGEVRIIARQEPPSEQFPVGSLLLGVKDQGLGIPEAYLKKLGEKFVRVPDQAHQSAGGTGIGLYLVKNLVERHGGYMWPESEGPNKGSTFFFRIPLVQPEQPAQQ